MQINQKLVDLGLEVVTQKIVNYFPHLELVAQNSAKDFAYAACSLAAVEGVSAREYWLLSGVAAMRY